jgi:predicted phage baseplate assembly protein
MTAPECRNDCEQLRWFPEHLSDRRPWNRPGLSRIAYRIGTYANFRQALLRNLNRDAVLRGWSHRVSDDPGIALLEGASILCDILTFYQELYANEAYLETARWRESVSDLVRLLGYRLAPGLGGRGVFAFGVSGSEPLTVPESFPLTAQVTGMDGQADFETTSAMVAFPWLSRFNLFRPLFTPYITRETNEFVVVSPDPAAAPLDLRDGDRLLVGQPYPASNPNRLIGAEIVLVDDVTWMHGEKRYRIKGSLSLAGSTLELAAFKIGRSFRHFGHTSPPTKITITGGTATESAVTYERRLSDATTTGVSPALEAVQVPLEGKVDDLALRTPLVCQSVLRRSTRSPLRRLIGSSAATEAVMTLIRTVEAVRPNSYTWGAVTAPVTLVVLDAVLTTSTNPAVDTWESSPHVYDRFDIREAQFHETLSPLITIRAAPEPTGAVSGHDLYYFGTDAEVQALANRSVLLARDGSDPQAATVRSIETSSTSIADRPSLRRVSLDAVVSYADFPHVAPRIAVYGNLAEATQGKTERESILGNGDYRQAFQTFKLPKSPQTYLTDVSATPPQAPELEIYVAHQRWNRVPTLFGVDPEEESYIVREDADGDSWVQFGDGRTGARLPSGIKNVRAIQRIGLGAFGSLKDGTKVQAPRRAPRLEWVDLPGAISGGQAPESGDGAREAAPGNVQSLDRLVSLRDFETETLAIAGVSKATAAWDLVDNVPAVALTVLMQTGRVAELGQVRQVVAMANRCRGPGRLPVVVRQGSVRYAYLDVTVAVAPEVRPELIEQAVGAALGVLRLDGAGIEWGHGLFAERARNFGEPEYAARIEGQIQNVPGVLWAAVDGFGSLGTAADPSTLVPPAAPWPLVPLVSCDPDEVLGLVADHLDLTLAVPSSAECP